MHASFVANQDSFQRPTRLGDQDDARGAQRRVRRPAQGALVGLVAVLGLTGIALLVGPPV